MTNFKQVTASVFAFLAIMMLTTACSDSKSEDATTYHVTELATEATDTAPAEASTADDGLVTYTVAVKNTDGEVVEDVWIQLCVNNQYQIPEPTSADGSISFRVEKNDYQVKIYKVPDRYLKNSVIYFFNTDNTLEIIIEKIPTDTI